MKVVTAVLLVVLCLVGCRTNTDSISTDDPLEYPPSAEFLKSQAAAGQVAYAICAVPGGWSIHYGEGPADIDYFLQVVRVDTALWDLARARNVIGIAELDGPAVLVYSAIPAGPDSPLK